MFSFASCPAVRNRDIASLTCEVGPSNPALGLTLSLNGEELIVNPREEQFTGLGYPGMITRLDYASPPVYRENGPFTYRCCMVDGTSDCPVVPCQECTLDIHCKYTVCQTLAILHSSQNQKKKIIEEREEGLFHGVYFTKYH